MISNHRDDFNKCNYFYMFCKVYRSHPWRHGYSPSGLRVPEVGIIGFLGPPLFSTLHWFSPFVWPSSPGSPVIQSSPQPYEMFIHTYAFLFFLFLFYLAPSKTLTYTSSTLLWRSSILYLIVEILVLLLEPLFNLFKAGNLAGQALGQALQLAVSALQWN